MYIDKTGSDITAFRSLFLDGKGQSFRLALSNSFSFASKVVQMAQETVPDHKLGLWDQAVQYKLAKTIGQEKPLVDGVALYLEKEDSQMVGGTAFLLRRHKDTDKGCGHCLTASSRLRTKHLPLN